MFKKIYLMAILVLTVSLLTAGVALAAQCDETSSADVNGTAACGCPQVTTTHTRCSKDIPATFSDPTSDAVAENANGFHADATIVWIDGASGREIDWTASSDSAHTMANDSAYDPNPATIINHTYPTCTLDCPQVAERQYTILEECVRNGKYNCQKWVIYGCALKNGHTGACIFTKVLDSGEDHTNKYEDGCVKYLCPTCGGTIANTDGHKNYCSVCKVCSASAHVVCTHCDTCLTTEGLVDHHFYCATCDACDSVMHVHCSKCDERIDGIAGGHTGWTYCATCKSCFPVAHVHCSKCGSTHPADYTYCKDCKACFPTAHTYCSECGRCTTYGHKETCSKYSCACGGTNPGVVSGKTHKLGCPYYQCPICGKIGEAAVQQHLAGYAIKNAMTEDEAAALLASGAIDCDDLICGSTPCYRCGGTILKHLNVCPHCGVCNGEHLDPKKVCACGMCEYDGVTAASKHYNYCSVCNTCGGNHLSYCSNKNGKLANPKPAWEKGGVVIGSSSQNPSSGSSSTSSKSDTPKTGDNSVSYAVLLSLLAMSAVCFVAVRKKFN